MSNQGGNENKSGKAPNTKGEAETIRLRLNMAPRAGLEPATLRLTAGCSTIELPGNKGFEAK